MGRAGAPHDLPLRACQRAAVVDREGLERRYRLRFNDGALDAAREPGAQAIQLARRSNVGAIIAGMGDDIAGRAEMTHQRRTLDIHAARVGETMGTAQTHTQLAPVTEPWRMGRIAPGDT